MDKAERTESCVALMQDLDVAKQDQKVRVAVQPSETETATTLPPLTTRCAQILPRGRILLFAVLAYALGYHHLSFAWFFLILTQVLGNSCVPRTKAWAFVGLGLWSVHQAAWYRATSVSCVLMMVLVGVGIVMRLETPETPQIDQDDRLSIPPNAILPLSTGSRQGGIKWINDLLIHVWPQLNQSIAESLVDFLQPALNDQLLPLGPIKAIRIKTFDLGDKAPQILHIHGLSTDQQKSHALDIDCIYAGTPNVVLEIVLTGRTVVPVSLDSARIAGCLRLEFQHLVPIWPLFSSIGYSFTKQPRIEFQLNTLSMNVMNLPLLSTWLHRLIQQGLEQYFVLPAQFVAPDWTQEMAAHLSTKQAELQQSKP